MRIHVPSTTCVVISFNGQGQLCALTCAGWRDLSNHTKWARFILGDQRKRQKTMYHWPEKFHGNCFTTHIPFLLTDPKILKAFPNTFRTKMKPTKCLAREKKLGKKSEIRGEERKLKRKVKTAGSRSRNFAFCACPNFASWYFACRIRRSRNVRPANSSVVS